MADVLLISYPPAQKPKDMQSPCPPLDACIIASMLETGGHTVAVYDVAVEESPLDKILASERPSIVGLAVPSAALQPAERDLAIIRSVLPGAKVVLTGQHVTGDPSITSGMGVDYGVRGFPCAGFTRLSEFIMQGIGSLEEIEGLVRHAGNKITLSNSKHAESEKIPFPAWHLLDIKRYNYFPIAGSLGCPFRCDYCRSTGPFYPWRDDYLPRPPADIVAEIKQGASLGISTFDFIDGVFTHDRKWVNDLCGLLEEECPKARWACSTRPDKANLEILKAMKKAGCVQVSMGVESGCERVRRANGRDITDRTIRQAFQDCRKAGLNARATAIIGLPGETSSEIEDTLAFISELRPAHAGFYPAILVPGSKLLDRAIKEGIMPRDAWTLYMQGRMQIPIYLPEGITREEISNYLKDAHSNFYNIPL
ncbi:MAG: B12-binding domain-containing radical SAM protein [Candidatus Altiarchaeota archaeon]|nr:B12-binding domain-containing radical SAM protein [Candidatus Altiarchaeota archaeon]